VAEVGHIAGARRGGAAVGLLAASLLAGFAGNECGGGAPDPCSGIECSLRGFCIADQGTAYCACLRGYHPSRLTCVADDPGDPCRGVDCSGHGACVDDAGYPRCACDPGYHHPGAGDPRCGEYACVLLCVPDEGSQDGGADAPACPPGMALVPAGPCVMGSDPGEGFVEEEPEHVVTLAAYCIDLAEVTVAEYRACVDAGICEEPGLELTGPDDGPVAWIYWNDAQTYCLWAGKRLPTEAEWEKAARGGCEIVPPETCGPEDERTYPWGDDAPTCERANLFGCGGDRQPVGSHPAGDSPYGVHDACGNAAEWVSDWFAWSYGACPDPCTDPRGPETGVTRVLRGGAYDDAPADARTAARDELIPGIAADAVGFRCARSP
jgi:formylglycine-generating enzyme required for sulfatase activity